ncbi:hypothetical protein [Neobacillus niacini]|uniref:hypothetical protein n=1 Tax=Neobacillus niacini TaxID=86668 RepID=UPI0021CB28EB|nr:hypothetical protein [Neobacillus niacini]MCM3763440.1 hypothetical protein [Neobacillus niacini]
MLEVSQKFKDNIYAPIRKITARIYFTLYGNTKMYDSKIISLNLLEEMNTINNTLPSNELKVTLDNTAGDFNILNLSKQQEIIASRPKIVVEFGLDFEDGSAIEWVPMGTYFLIEWKNETAAMSISLIGRDNLDMLSQVSYTPIAGSITLYNLAVDVLTKAGITNYSIDDSLKLITTTGFSDRLDSRTALQHIGVASKSAVYQDRNGVIIIKPFKVLDQSSNYLSHAGSQRSALGGFYAGASSYPAVLTDFDMKIIDYDNIFQEPEVSLEKSPYEVIVNVYEPGGTREVVYINSSINGKNGASFKIDNPLINTESLAAEVAAWIIAESNWNAVYKTVWRQNPILECADVILVEDSFDAKKQTRIFKQEFEFIGYLRGNTESRGGI